MGRKIKRTIYEGQARHARKRFKQYFHIDFNSSMRKEFKRIIRKGLAEIISNENNNRPVYEVPYKGEKYKVVYYTFTNNIVTVLPPDAKL